MGRGSGGDVRQAVDSSVAVDAERSGIYGKKGDKMMATAAVTDSRVDGRVENQRPTGADLCSASDRARHSARRTRLR